mgnify:CR=1 FL=1
MSNNINQSIIEYASDTIQELCELRSHRDNKSLSEAQFNLDVALASGDLDEILIKTNEARAVIYDTTERRTQSEGDYNSATGANATSQTLIW